jgi:hypothetical protein
MRTVAFAALAAAGLAVWLPSFAADSPDQNIPVIAPGPAAPENAQQKSGRRHKIIKPHVLARPSASPNNGAASAIGAQ